MTDAATQTDSDASDAAVQWPADVYQVVTTDHAYTDKHELDKQEEEDTWIWIWICSLQVKNPDPEYNVHLSPLKTPRDHMLQLPLIKKTEFF